MSLPPDSETKSSRLITAPPTTVDHVVHGLVTIRLIAPPPHIVDALVAALGPSQGLPAAEPDMLVTFTDELPRHPGLRLAELNGATFAFDAQAFYLQDRRGRRTRVDIDKLDRVIELQCERHIGEIPLLVPFLSLLLLRKRHVLLHASSFVYDNKGILVAGWQSGGKSEMLLAFMAAGAYYLADEWTIVDGADGTLRGLMSTVNIWDWQFRYLPQYWARIAPADRRRIQIARVFQRLLTALPGAASGTSLPFRLLRHLAGQAAHVARAATAPQQLFGSHVWQGPATLDRLFLASVTHAATAISPLDPTDIARRMIASLAYERHELWATLQRYQFAFPGRGPDVLANVSEAELQLLSQAFAGRPAYEISHPYPVPLQELYTTAAPLCQ